MKNFLIGSAFLLTVVTGCQTTDTAVTPEISSTSVTGHIIGRDSLYTGNYLGLVVNDEAENVYKVVQTLQQTKGVTYLNIVSNFASDFAQLRERIPLYQYMLLDQNRGTDSGVQINLEADQIKSIYLNSGTKLTQWPANSKTSSIRVGDTAGSLYEKLASIRQVSAYATTFERILLLTKNLSKPYDPAMRQSPQWYFAYTTEPNRMDEVQIHFKDGKVDHIYVTHYQTR
ncbi:hypothetical protein [Larkinella terrae]|uniref:Lipoprotein n=1 Tax=Larkinella terrae TaxID=2025311 RepID=A0A7K0EER5_9BACT|nr:hypothetical protein [Larkinella terrae]MRS60071.1 hypothetical protein [Larkinella terrae]